MNFKALLAHRPGKLLGIACGLQNVATKQKAVPYLIATTQPRATGYSLGAIRPNGGAFYGIAGLSYNVTPTVQIVTDMIGGRSNYGTLGIIATVTKISRSISRMPALIQRVILLGMEQTHAAMSSICRVFST